MPLPVFHNPPENHLGTSFWEGVDAGELRLGRCSSCQRWQWYPDDVGPCCPGATYEWTAVAGTGTVHTFTTVRRSFLPGASTAPYTVGLVELDGVDGVRLVSNLDADVEWSIGDRVTVRFDEVDGRAHPVFVPA
jgi:uncharacterized OB-fold protein